VVFPSVVLEQLSLFRSLCYVVLGRLLQLAALRFRSEKFKELEIMVLRHKLSVLGRQAGRPELKPADQVFLWVKTQVASRGTTICRQNADLEAPTDHAAPPPRAHSCIRTRRARDRRSRLAVPKPNCRQHRLGSPST
jgi:hypothetical protein